MFVNGEKVERQEGVNKDDDDGLLVVVGNPLWRTGWFPYNTAYFGFLVGVHIYQRRATETSGETFLRLLGKREGQATSWASI